MKNRSWSITSQTFYQNISAAFCIIVVMSNIISAKMVSLPYFDLTIPAGLMIYPLTFLLSNLVSEIFGPKKAKLMVYTAFGMSLLSFSLIQFALILPTKAPESQNAFHTLLGLSGLRVLSSLTAYLITQIVDIQIYAWIKRWTKARFLWLRNNGSTCISQMIDTIVIDLIFLYWGLGMEMGQVFLVMLFSFAYKAIFSLLCTPLYYFCVLMMRRHWSGFEGFDPSQNVILETSNH
ncbi:MAG: queuosine precursor transporter [Chlamydiales bacterium]